MGNQVSRITIPLDNLLNSETHTSAFEGIPHHPGGDIEMRDNNAAHNAGARPDLFQSLLDSHPEAGHAVEPTNAFTTQAEREEFLNTMKSDGSRVSAEKLHVLYNATGSGSDDKLKHNEGHLNFVAHAGFDQVENNAGKIEQSGNTGHLQVGNHMGELFDDHNNGLTDIESTKYGSKILSHMNINTLNVGKSSGNIFLRNNHGKANIASIEQGALFKASNNHGHATLESVGGKANLTNTELGGGTQINKLLAGGELDVRQNRGRIGIAESSGMIESHGNLGKENLGKLTGGEYHIHDSNGEHHIGELANATVHIHNMSPNSKLTIGKLGEGAEVKQHFAPGSTQGGADGKVMTYTSNSGGRLDVNNLGRVTELNVAAKVKSDGLLPYAANKLSEIRTPLAMVGVGLAIDRFAQASAKDGSSRN